MNHLKKSYGHCKKFLAENIRFFKNIMCVFLSFKCRDNPIWYGTLRRCTHCKSRSLNLKILKYHKKLLEPSAIGSISSGSLIHPDQKWNRIQIQFTIQVLNISSRFTDFMNQGKFKFHNYFFVILLNHLEIRKFLKFSNY